MCKNSHLSKQLVCLEACKRLHQMGALDDHLLPAVEVSPDKHVNTNSKETASGPGMYAFIFLLDNRFFKFN